MRHKGTIHRVQKHLSDYPGENNFDPDIRTTLTRLQGTTTSLVPRKKTYIEKKYIIGSKVLPALSKFEQTAGVTSDQRLDHADNHDQDSKI